MRALHVIRESLSLLSNQDRRLLGVVTVAQMATGFLDLAGVFLLGTVSVLSISLISDIPPPPIVQTAIDRMGWADVPDESLAAWFCLAAGAALITKSIFSAILTRRTFRFLAFRQAALSARLTASLLSRPLLEIQARASQDIAFVITVATQAATIGILGAATTAIADISLLVVLGAGLTYIDPVVTVFSVMFFGIIALVLQRSMSGWATRVGKESADVDIEAYQAIQEAIAGYREITVADRRWLYVGRIQALRWKAATLNADSQFMLIVPKYVFEIALVIGALALAVSQAATKDAAAAVGIVAVFLVAGSRVMPAVMRLQVAGLAIRRAEPPASKAFDLARDLGVAQVGIGGGGADAEEWRRRLEHGFPDFDPCLSVEEVVLRYPGVPTPAIAGVSFSAPAGSSVALVGSTGAGKSTLADLLLGVVEPDSGRTAIGGLTPTEAVSRWPGGIAYVPQEVALLNGTVRDNVAVGLPREAFEDDWVWDALERSHLASFLREGREGLETLIGENGTRLSGGQRQRLGLARALFTRPRFLVLDEATSALDAETENAIAQTVVDLGSDVTTVTIAHRLATIRHCDLVLYLEHGKILARGTFDEVRAQSAEFNRQAQILGL